MSRQFRALNAALRGIVSTVGFTALVGCGSLGSSDKTRSTETAPRLEEVISSNSTDMSCSCLNDGNCAMLSDVMHGRFEGRALLCRQSNNDTSFECVLDERFITILEDTESAGPWTTVTKTLVRSPKGGWCVM